MVFFFFSSRRRHTRCALVTGVQTCALPISTVRKADALLERARQTDGAILAIHVFDAAGRIVHSTAEPAPAAISAETLAVRRASEGVAWHRRSEEHTSELQSLMRISYAVFCLKTKQITTTLPYHKQ